MNLVHAIDGGIMKNAVFPVRAVNDLAGDFILCVVEPVNLLCGGVRAEHFLRQKAAFFSFAAVRISRGFGAMRPRSSHVAVSFKASGSVSHQQL